MNEKKIKALSACNYMPIYSVEDEAFRSYGRIVRGYDFSSLISYMQEHTSVPQQGNCYVASAPELEQDALTDQLQGRLYGGMPIQIGYSNGRNSSYNGFEYHKCSEINVAATDFLLALGHTWEMEENTFHTDQAKVFLVEKGTAIEMYQTTLHLAPCKIADEGYKCIVILARGTNTELPPEKTGSTDGYEEISQTDEIGPESAILLKRNKWIIAHPDWEPLRKQGAYPGVQGENRILHYPEKWADV